MYMLRAYGPLISLIMPLSLNTNSLWSKNKTRTECYITKT